MKELLPSIFLFICGLMGISLLWSNGLAEAMDNDPYMQLKPAELSVRAISIPENVDSSYILLQSDIRLFHDSTILATR